MKIIVFGCSFSAGVKGNNHYSWVNALGEKYPEFDIEMFALKGASILYQIYLLEQYLPEYIPGQDPNVKVIFQITNKGRFSAFGPEPLNQINLEKALKVDLNNDRIVVTPNVKRFARPEYNVNYTKGLLATRDTNIPHVDHDFAEKYYSYIDPSISDLEHKIFMKWVEDKADLVYIHKDAGSSIHVPEIPCIESILDAETWNHYLIDDAGHFNTTGSRWVADWISDQIGL